MEFLDESKEKLLKEIEPRLKQLTKEE